jgi:integrase
MGRIQDVRVFGIQDRRSRLGATRPWVVRWRVEGRHRSRAWRTKAEADHHRSELLVALRNGERFDAATGEPDSWLRNAAADVQVYAWARRWLAEQWPEWQPRTRASAVEALARFAPLVHLPMAPAPPEGLRAYLVDALPPPAEVDPADPRERWLARWSLTLQALDRELLAGVERQLVTGLHGQPLAASVAGRYRKVARACIRRAVDLDVLATDPWPPAPRGRSRRKALRRRRAVDARRLPGPDMMATAIGAIRSHQPASHMYEVMTAVAYYAGLRPSEVVMLRHRVLELPAMGWGKIHVREADIGWDEPGEPKEGQRSVPIPPILVTALQSWVAERGIDEDALIFRTCNDTRPTPSNWARALKRGLAAAGCPSMRVYDCRHAAATTWLRAGVPLGEVARRLGHSVETLVSTYVGALDGDEAVANERIDAALAPGRPLAITKSAAARARPSGAPRRPATAPATRRSARDRSAAGGRA